MRANPETLSSSIAGERAVGTLYGTGRQGVLLVHGLCADSREMGPLPRVLAERGLTAVAIDLRCHGASAGAPRGYVTRERVLEDLTAWRDLLAQRGVALAAVGGHSLGAAMTLWAAPRLGVGAWFGVAVPSSIVAELSAGEVAAYRVGGAAHRILSAIGVRGARVPYKVTAEDTLDDPARIKRMESDGTILTHVPLANVAPLLALDAVAWAAECKCPGLVAACTSDRVVTAAHTREVYLAYGGPKAWRDIPAAHSCFYDSTGEKAAAVVADWLEGALG